MRKERLEKIEALVRLRQLDLTVILENIHDPHNISACLRTCDAVGISEIFILYSEPELSAQKFKPGKRTSSGTKKWVQSHLFFDRDECLQVVRSKYQRVIASAVSSNNKDLYDLDLTTSTAFVFGNEFAGVTQETLTRSDGTFTIPMVGMVDSLNLSVACAVTLYETFRQRSGVGMYGHNTSGTPDQFQRLLQKYIDQ